jgi:hypothetical protein
MNVLDEVGIWGKANDNHLFPEFAFPAQSIIRDRIGFFDWDVPGMWFCHFMIKDALSYYQLKLDMVERPDLHEKWKADRDETIERALSRLEEELQRQGIQVS